MVLVKLVNLIQRMDSYRNNSITTEQKFDLDKELHWLLSKLQACLWAFAFLNNASKATIAEIGEAAEAIVPIGLTEDESRVIFSWKL